MQAKWSDQPRIGELDRRVFRPWFLEAGEAEKREAAPALITNANRLLDLFHERKLPVIRIQTRHKAGGSTWSRWKKENDAPRLIEGTRDVEWMYDRFVNLAVYAMLKRDWPEERGRSR